MSEEEVTASLVRGVLNRGHIETGMASREMQSAQGEALRKLRADRCQRLRAQVTSLTHAVYEELRSEDMAHGALLLSRMREDTSFTSVRVKLAFRALKTTLASSTKQAKRETV